MLRVRFCLKTLSGIILLFLLSFTARAQANDASFRLTKVSATGAPSLDESQIVQVSGLSVGENVTLQNLHDAANRLAQYGMFQEVSYEYQTHGSDMDLVFKVVAAKNLLTSKFENFVWFTPAELNSELLKSVPLYAGAVPASGQMSNAVSSALRSMLKSRGVPGDVNSILSSAGPGQPITALEFSVTGVSLPIQEVHFPGANAIPEDTLRDNAKFLLGQDYTQSGVDTFVRESFNPLYGERGYLRTQFDKPVVRVLDSNLSHATQAVAVTVPVHEGASYDWGGAVWNGNQVLSSAALEKLLGMPVHSAANMTKYEQGMKSIQNAYLNQGYLQTKIIPQQILDDATRQVSYRFSIEEGPQYRMGTLTINGLSANLSKQIAKTWKLHPGDAYDGNYLKVFMKQAMTDLFKSGHPSSNAKISMNPDQATHTVNVEINFQ